MFLGKGFCRRANGFGMARPSPRSRWIFGALLTSLFVWGLLLAVGAYLHRGDLWVSLVVGVCLLAFIGFWAVLLMVRAGTQSSGEESDKSSRR